MTDTTSEAASEAVTPRPSVNIHLYTVALAATVALPLAHEEWQDELKKPGLCQLPSLGDFATGAVVCLWLWLSFLSRSM